MEQLKVKTKQYIDKDALIAEIDSILNETNYKPFTDEVLGERKVCKDIKDFINTLEVKEEVLDKNDKTKLMQKCVHKAYKRGYDMGVLLTTNEMNHNMKEVDLEKEYERYYGQKAKAYDEALERMKLWARGEHPECFTEAQKTAEFIFPELCESKDERIRKELIEFVKSRGGFKQEYIAWLEKQGEQKSAWSREDEKIRQTIINEFKQCSEWYCSNGLTKEDCINWLNKQEYFEWGDEDNENMNSLCVLLDQMVSINAIGNEHSIEYKNWLKSIKQRMGG